jgi:hypothetical protein
MTAADRQQWSRGSVQDWANETFEIASKEIYAHVTGGEAAAP